MNYYYDYWLVVLSFLLAIIASFSALGLVSRILHIEKEKSWLWLAGGSVAMGTGIWSMHFVGMLAFHLPIELVYDTGITLLSLVIAVFSSWLALFLIRNGITGKTGLTLSAILMGSGITGMHYTGMAALRIQPPIEYNIPLVLLSLLIAVLSSLFAISYSFHKDNRRPLLFSTRSLLSAHILGIGIASMHYTGMLAADFQAGSICLGTPYALDSRTLAYLISGTTLFILLTSLAILYFEVTLANKNAVMVNYLQEYNASLEEQIQERAANLKINETRFRELLEQSPLSTQIFSPEGKLLIVNRAFEKLWDVKFDDLHDYNILEDPELERWGVKPYFIHGFNGHSMEIPSIKYDSSFLKKNQPGKAVWVKSFLYPVINEQGNIKEMVLIQQDITRQKDAAEEIITAMETAEKANKAKSEFLSRMSHELRTPLNAILGFSQLIEMGDPERDTLENIIEIHKAGTLLLNLINEILDLSRIEAGRLEIRKVKVNLNQVLAECLTLVSSLASKHSIAIIDNITPVNTDEIIADEIRFKQILLNLLTNAIKYNKKLGTVTLNRFDEEDDLIRIEITDSGEGLTEHQIQNLFHPFERLGAENTAKEGTGIGLVIAQRLIQLMEGDIGVISSPGSGSTFWVKIRRYNPDS